jgi:hypothetical protein
MREGSLPILRHRPLLGDEVSEPIYTNPTERKADYQYTDHRERSVVETLKHNIVVAYKLDGYTLQKRL